MTMPAIGVGALVLRRTRNDIMEVLLVKRKYPPFPGYWSIPGGHVEAGETIFEAAMRELYEETRIEAKPIGIVDVHELILRENGLKRHYVIVDVLMEYLRGEPVAGSDAIETGFHSLPEALSMKVTPATRKLLLKIVKGQLIMPFQPTITICTPTGCK